MRLIKILDSAVMYNLVETLNPSERFSRPERAFSLRFAAFVPLA